MPTLDVDKTISIFDGMETLLLKQLPYFRRAIKTDASCLPGFHSHGQRRCHPMEERHQQKAIQDMGGEEAYYSLHPSARPKAEPGKPALPRQIGEREKRPRRPLADKWYDNSKTAALLSNEFKTIEERKQGMLATIPPKWHDTVVFNSAILSQPNPHIFATSQSWLFKYSTTNPKTGKVGEHIVYSKNHLDSSDQEKWERMKIVARDIGRIRTYADSLIASNEPTHKDLGAIIRLLDITGFRIGGAKYAEESGTFGISTLLKQHVKALSNNKIEMNFVGKAGVAVERRRFTVPPNLYRHIASKLGGRKNQPLWSVGEAHVRQALAPFGLHPKDLRTFKVNMLVAQMLNKGPQYRESPIKRERHVKAVIKQVAGVIGHTPAVSRKSYINPSLVQNYLDGNTMPIETLFKKQIVYNKANYDGFLSAPEKIFVDYVKNIHLV